MYFTFRDCFLASEEASAETNAQELS
jgi:hypothetical protein